MGACCGKKKTATELLATAVSSAVDAFTDGTVAVVATETPVSTPVAEAVVSSTPSIVLESLTSTATSVAEMATPTYTSNIFTPSTTSTFANATPVVTNLAHGASTIKAVVPECKIQMLWNWDTIDTCFLTETWHIFTKGQFAGTCIAVFLMVVTLELLRRLQRNYERKLVLDWAAKQNSNGVTTPNVEQEQEGKGEAGAMVAAVELTGRNGIMGWLKPFKFSPTVGQQLVRTAMHTAQFMLAYIIMLLAM